VSARAVRWSALAAIAIVLSGCWDYVDLERRAPVMGLAIDVDKDGAGGGIVVTAEFARATAVAQTSASQGGGLQQEVPFTLISASGPTVAEALRNLDGSIARRILWQQLIAVVVSMDVLRENLAPILDPILRNPEVNSRAKVFVSAGDARDVLAYQPDFQPFSAIFLDELGEGFTYNPRFARPRSVHELDSDLEEGAALLPVVVDDDHGRKVLAGAAIVANGTFAGRIDAETTEGANWLLGYTLQSLVYVPCPVAPDNSITLMLSPGRRHVRGHLDQDVPHFELSLRASARIVDMARCPLQVKEVKYRRLIERQASQLLAQRAQKAADTARELGIDFIRLRSHARRLNPDLALPRTWAGTFPKSVITINADVKLRDAGELYRTPF